MLNLLISILGDSFERFQVTEVIIDYKETINLIIEILSMKKLKSFQSLKFLHVCISANENEEDENWEGRIRYMDTKLDKNFKNLPNELAQDKSAFKDKISAFENKMALSEKKIEAKISSVEEKIQAKISSIEGNIEAKILGVETKINSVNETLEAILRLVQK